MRRFLIIFLGVVIVVSGVFSYIRLSLLGEQESRFNTEIRPKLAVFPVLRDVFLLNDYGDGVTDYLGDRFDHITVIVSAMEDIEPEKNALEAFRMTLEKITSKRVTLEFSGAYIPFMESVSKDKARVIMKSIDRKTQSSSSAHLSVLYLSEDSESTSLLGETYNEAGIFIYSHALDTLTRDIPEGRNPYEYGTLLHEFGHQLGLEHSYENTSCLMYAEDDDLHMPTIIHQRDGIVKDFCPVEYAQIEVLKANIGD